MTDNAPSMWGPNVTHPIQSADYTPTYNEVVRERDAARAEVARLQGLVEEARVLLHDAPDAVYLVDAQVGRLWDIRRAAWLTRAQEGA